MKLPFASLRETKPLKHQQLFISIMLGRHLGINRSIFKRLGKPVHNLT